MSEWISVEERLPGFNERVLISSCDGNVVIAERDFLQEEVDWHWRLPMGSIQFRESFTHWMPLPDPPVKPDLTIEESLKLAVMDLSLLADCLMGGTKATAIDILDACSRVVRYRDVLERAGKW